MGASLPPTAVPREAKGDLIGVERIDAMWRHLKSEVRGWRRPDQVDQVERRSLALSSSSSTLSSSSSFSMNFVVVIVRLFLWLTVVNDLRAGADVQRCYNLGPAGITYMLAKHASIIGLPVFFPL